MSRIIDRGLEEQAVLLVKMGELAYQTIEISMNGYLECKSVEPEVRELSDLLVAMCNKVEDQTFQLIARYQPVASDLRAIKSYMKIGNDFARYGRYALDIAVIDSQIIGVKKCKASTIEYIREMSDKVLLMVRISIDALKKHDADLAKTISQTEREVDKIYLTYLDRLVQQKQSDRKFIVSSVLIIRYLERIADHAVYACESIVYIVKGEKVSLD